MNQEVKQQEVARRKAKKYRVLGEDSDEQKIKKINSIFKTKKFYYEEEFHFHQPILQAASWEFDTEIFQKFYNEVYEEYAVRLYREEDIKECLLNALQLSSYLTLLKEPEKELVDLFNYVRDGVFWRHARESAFKDKEKTEFVPIAEISAQSAPTAFFLDGIFSAMYVILYNQQHKSVNLQITLRMIETHLYSYIKSLNKQHQIGISRWGMPYTSEVAGMTLLDALRNNMKDIIPIQADSWRHYIGVGDENLKEYTSKFNIEDVRIITSLIPTIEGQEQFLSNVVTSLRSYVRELLNTQKVTFNIWEPLHVYTHHYGMKSAEELLPIDADNYDACVDSIVNNLCIPASWGKVIADGDGGHFVKMSHKLPVIYYGTTEAEKLKDILHNLDYVQPGWFSLKDNPNAVNYKLYKAVCNVIQKINKWNQGLTSQDVCDAIAMVLNVRDNITDPCMLAQFFSTRARANNPENAFRLTLLNLVGWLSSEDVGVIPLNVSEIQQLVIGNTIDEKHRSAIRKGRGEDRTGMNKNVASAFENIRPYLYDKITYRKQLANYAL